jgi:hypothetical protein
LIHLQTYYNLRDLLTGNLKPEDIAELKKAFSDLGKSTIAAFTGIGTAADEMAAKVESLQKLVETADKLGDEIRDRILSRAQAELDIEKLLFAAKDKTLRVGETQLDNDKRRLSSLKQAVQLSLDQLKIDLDLATRKERLFTAELLHKKGIINSEAEANAVLAKGTTLLQDQSLDDQLEERRKLQADVINLQRNFFSENKKSVAQIAALEKEITDEMIKQAEIQTRARVKALDDYLAKTKEVDGRVKIGFKSVVEENQELQNNFNQRMVDDAKKREEEEKERQKRYTALLKAEEEKRRIIRETAIVAVGMIGDEIFNRRQEQLAEEGKKIEEQRDKELAAAGDDERKKLAINRKFDREQAKIKTKQAQADKQAAIFGIIINTALGIMKAAPVVPLMVATGILGAIQLAIVASKPIPKFATGTDSAPDTFIAGEKGREIIQHKGKLSLADRATLFTGMAGARVFSNPATEEILGDIGDVGHALNYGSKVRRAAPENYVLVEKLQEGNKLLKRIAEKSIGGVTIIDNYGDNRYYNRVARRNQRINRRFRGE